jgi:hypothetical protein
MLEIVGRLLRSQAHELDNPDFLQVLWLDEITPPGGMSMTAAALRCMPPKPALPGSCRPDPSSRTEGTAASRIGRRKRGRASRLALATPLALC